MRLSFKITSSFFTIFFIGIALLSYAAYHAVQLRLEEAAMNKTQAFVLQAQNKIDRLLFNAQQDARLVAAQDTIIRALATGAASEQQRARTQLIAAEKLSGPWRQLFVVRTDGTVLVAAGESTHSRTRSFAPYPDIVLDEIKRGNFYISEYLFSSDGTEPSLIIAAPVIGAGGSVVGAVIGHFPWRVVREALRASAGDMQLTLFSREGLQIDDSTTTLASLGFEQFVARSDEPHSDVIVASSVSPERVLVSATRLSGSSWEHGKDWALVAQIPAALAFAPAASAARSLVAAILVFLVLIASVFLILIRYFVADPLRLLARATAAFKKGDFSERISYESSDEIGLLAVIFNQMATSLESTYHDLEEKIRERTAALVTARSMDEAILAGIGDGLFVTDRNGKITFVNPAFTRLLGWRWSVGKTIRADELVSREKNAPRAKQRSIDRVIFETIQGGKQIHLGLADDCWLATKEGGVIPVSVTISPVMIGQRCTGAVVVFRDVSHERAADRAKTEFVSLASHQLRTPLTIVRWYVDLLSSGDLGSLTPQQMKPVREIDRGVQRLIEMVNAFLNVSRIELGIFAVEVAKTDVGLFLKQLVAEYRPLIRDRQLRCAVSVAQQLPTVLLDPQLLRIVIQNVLSNAIKYTHAGDTVRVSAQKLKKNDIFGGRVAPTETIGITIADTGCGIPEQQWEHIFTKLFRADNVRRLDTDGSGLGLYIARSIMVQTGGSIWFESREGSGTRFYIAFPLTGMKRRVGAKRLL